MRFSRIHLSAIFYLIFHLANPISAQHTFQKAFTKDSVLFGVGDIIAAPGGYVLSGESYLNTPAPGPDSRPFLMKMDPEGNVLWLRYYGIGFQTAIYKVVEANDGGFLAVGTSVGGFNSDGYPQFFLIKTDTAGIPEWQKIIPSYTTNRKNGGDWVYPVADGYILTGNSKRSETHATLTKINNQGETVWSKRYFKTFFDHPAFYADYVRGDTIYAVGLQDSLALFSLIDAKNGAIFSSLKIQGSPLPDAGHYFTSIAPATNGDWIITGSSPNIGPLWVCRVSRMGELRWSNVYPGFGSGRVSSMSDGNFLLTQTYRVIGPGSDPLLLKINGDGEVLWTYQYGLPSADALQATVQTPDGGALSAGVVELSGYTHSSNKIYGLLAVRTDSNGLIPQCCSRPLNIVPVPYPVSIAPTDFSQTDFDPTIDFSLPVESDQVNTLDYCPPVPDVTQVSLCPGDSIILGGKVYKTPGQVLVTVPGMTCDTNRLYVIQAGVNPKTEKDIFFCPGDSVTLFGHTYTEPVSFTHTIPASGGRCDTLVTFHLQYATTTVSTVATMHCPPNLTVQIPYGAQSAPVAFPAPTAQTTCPCPGIEIQQTLGLPSGTVLPSGNETVCFQAQDSCGNIASCCFEIHVAADDTLPCDAKTNGCIDFQLLGITADSKGNRTYHIRLRNYCAQVLVYAAFQLPQGVVANAPADKAVYEAPSGRQYTVRNPNHSPMHSIQFKADGVGIANGASELFSYTLPPWSAPNYIKTLVKLSGLPLVEAYLNTFNCPVSKNTGSKDRNSAGADAVEPESQSALAGSDPELILFPNPAGAEVHVRLNGWDSGPILLRILDARGRLITTRETKTEALTLSLDLPAGVYFVEATAAENGYRKTARLAIW